MSKETMKLALEALENLHYDKGSQEHQRLDTVDAIKALEEALAKQEQGEPVCDKDPQGCYSVRCHLGNKCKNTPQPKQEQGEPVAWMRQDGQRVTTASDRHNYPDYETRYSIPLYATPQQRKPLTDEQIEAIAKEHIAVGTRSFEEFARRIEAAHGIKE